MDRVLVTGGSGFIGTPLVEEIARRGYALTNVDVNPPSDPDHAEYWRPCDIKDSVALLAVFEEFVPTRVIHLAAKASLNGRSVDDFPDNTNGTANVIACVNKTASVKLFVNTSTQYVVTPGVLPKDGSYLEPYTAYGESKAAAEMMVREECRRPWATVRPTNIWGPGHGFFPYELWRYLERRWYVHPGFQPIYKHYGYVENAVKQVLAVALSEPPEEVAGTVWYITDGPIDNAEWMNGFSVGLSGKPVRRVPLPLWRLMAVSGDLLKRVGLRFPISTDRLFRLTVSETLPESMIVKLPEGACIGLQEGIDRSIAWYRSIHSQKGAVGGR